MKPQSPPWKVTPWITIVCFVNVFYLFSFFLMFCLPGVEKLPSRRAQEWTTPTDQQFSVRVSPYVACVEAEGGEKGTNKQLGKEQNVNNTPRARPDRLLTATRETKVNRKGTKISKR